MTKSSTEIFNDKVSLIFEYDKSSPLFVRHANTEIDNNNVNRAIEILTGGIKRYPEYPTAYILYSKALMLIGEYGKALQQVKTACELLHSKKTYEYYLREIENIKKQRSLFASSRGSLFIPEPGFSEKEEQPDLFEQDFESEQSEEPSDIDERLGELAQEISTARIIEPPDENISSEFGAGGFAEGTTIVSETLAKIYVAQGEYKEAINVYEKLIYKTPAKREEYIQKIKELKSLLDS